MRNPFRKPVEDKPLFPNRQIHDYTRQCWGHAMGGLRETGETVQDGEFNINAAVENCHIFGRGFQVGDLIRVVGRSLTTYYLKIDSVNWMRDPSDMYYIDYHTVVTVPPGGNDPYEGQRTTRLFL